MSSPDCDVDTEKVLQYFSQLKNHLDNVAVSSDNEPLSLGSAFQTAIAKARQTHRLGKKLIFVGNGGSAAIASHMATDYSKNGRIRAMALNDSSMLTCLSNDLGYEQVFSHQVELYAQPDDLLVAISSSGRSQNILNAVLAARKAGCFVITFSGFGQDNALRKMGDLNFFVASGRYGYVELSHLIICHSILDSICGLPPHED